MKIKLVDASSLYSVVSNLSIGTLKDDADKLKLIRLSVCLKRYAQQWQDTIEAVKTMDSNSAGTLVKKEAAAEVDIPDNLLISTENVEALTVANSNTLTVGALGFLMEFFSGECAV